MYYIQVAIKHNDSAVREILIAYLADAGFESFEDNGTTVYAYIVESSYDKNILDEITSTFGCTYTTEKIKQENWNQQWEKSFEPVVVSDFCSVRASFHEPIENVEHEIIITPKMSFGTGHHATTRLMISQMSTISLQDTSVLDFGTGTGVLAILAKRLDANEVVAIDNDEWSYTNTLENIELNNAIGISVSLGSFDILDEGQSFDVILANINRHILIKYMKSMANKLNEGGYVLMSGILAEDEKLIVECALKNELVLQSKAAESNWICLLFCKHI